jgi:hypothetical protein
MYGTEQKNRLIPYFFGCRKRRLNDYQHWHLRWTAIGRRWAYHKSLSLVKCKCLCYPFGGKTFVCSLLFLNHFLYRTIPKQPSLQSVTISFEIDDDSLIGFLINPNFTKCTLFVPWRIIKVKRTNRRKQRKRYVPLWEKVRS